MKGSVLTGPRAGRWSRALARLPLLGLVVGCFLGVGSAELVGASAWALVLLLPLLWTWRRRAWRMLLLFLGWGVLWTVHGDRLHHQALLQGELESGGGGTVTVSGVVTRCLDRDGMFPGAWMRITEGRGKGALIGLRQMPGELLPGDRVRVRGSLRLPPGARNPGEMDRRNWMRRVGLAGELVGADLAVEKRPAWRYALLRWSWQWRGEVSERVTRGLDPAGREALLIRALVLGDRSQGGAELFGPFRRSGTMHVFAVSGLHVGLVGLMAWFLVRLLRLPRGAGLWLVLLLLWSYALVTGLRPPAFRAATMGTFLLLGFVLKRQAAVGNALLASVPVVLLLDSFQWRLPGFQLSYVVVGVILLLGSRVMGLLRPWIEGDPFLPRVLHTRWQELARGAREKAGGLAAVSATAWLGSFPLMRLYFGVITPMAVPASMLLVPVVFVILFLALGGMMVGLVFPPGGVVVNRANSWLVGGTYRMVRAMGEVPGGQLQFRQDSWGDDGILVFSLDDGGAATHLDAGGGVLLDTGSVREFHRVVRPSLRRGSYSPDSLVLTHPDGAHVGGALGAMAEWEVHQALVPTDWARSPGYRDFLEQAREGAPRLVQARTWDSHPLEDGVWLEILYVPDQREDRVADERGLVCRLHWKGWRILFTGDAGFVTEKELLARGLDLAAEVWVMGRHDSDFTGTLEFVDEVNPRVIVTSDRGYAETQRVPRAWAEQVRGRGIELWRLGDTGAVEISPRDEELALRAFRQPGEVRRITRE